MDNVESILKEALNLITLASVTVIAVTKAIRSVVDLSRELLLICNIFVNGLSESSYISMLALVTVVLSEKMR